MREISELANMHAGCRVFNKRKIPELANMHAGCRVFYKRKISELANMHAGCRVSISAKYLSLLICMPEIPRAFRASSSNDTAFPRMSNTIAKRHQ